MIKRDLDLTGNNLFSRKNIANIEQSLNILNIFDDDYEVNYEEMYGLICICCGDTIEYAELSSDAKFLKSIEKDKNLLKNEIIGDIRELCTKCDTRLENSYSKLSSDFYSLLSYSIQSECILTKNIEDALPTLRNIRSEKEMYSKERNEYVIQARTRGINIWD